MLEAHEDGGRYERMKNIVTPERLAMLSRTKAESTQRMAVST